MSTLKKITWTASMLQIVMIALLVSMFINGWVMLSGDEAALLKFLNIFNNPPKENMPSYFALLFRTAGLLQLGGAVFLLLALFRGEFLGNPTYYFVKWGLLLGIFSVTIFGFMTRITSNHGGSANLFFFGIFLYALLCFVETQTPQKINISFHKLKLIPIFLMLFYTMGFPGWQKLVNGREVLGKYVKMFSTSFLADMPGGVVPFIYFLGVLEIAVPILLLVSIAKGELRFSKRPFFLNLALLVSIATFTMLSFGLGVLLNYPGSSNLVVYATLSFGLYLYVRKQYDDHAVSTTLD